ncbi:MGH1-like glycoside hydrolase domain-containing protein [Terriglobus tenax]|uniref:MGH1-like glycoside hydrolase domain-containing protein n=1 Tax=Terriglobus tenax TaxID=1111115 RepID=UPI0021DFADB1|nr:alpha-L-rhamnosidase [Terriglobus tenax]
MKRRDFLAASSLTAGHLALSRMGLAQQLAPAYPEAPEIEFHTADTRWQTVYDKALAVLAANVRTLPRYTDPVLIEGSDYPGIWQECAPQEGLLYRHFRPDAARNNHLGFFQLQKPDGQLPASIKVSEVGYGQIQMVVPIAATAWELSQATGDHELLEKAYTACGRWDQWLMKFHNSRGTGLVEGYCTYDTGHDNSYRWHGVPNRRKDADATKWPDGIPGLPRLSPDLSATAYGGRIALAAMAKALGKPQEEAHWLEQAAHIRELILTKLYSEEDACFYDLDSDNKFVRVRGDAMIRVCGEHVPDQKLFNTLWERQIHNPKAFWAPFPLTSIAMDDPGFEKRPFPRNTWSGPPQALLALRVPRWMEHYGHTAEMSHLMDRWCDAILRDGTFRQQMDPANGEFTQSGNPNYSPCALVLMDFTWRLAGVRKEGDTLEWNIRPNYAASKDARFSLKFNKTHRAELTYKGNTATLTLDGNKIGTASGTFRLTTTLDGKVTRITGIGQEASRISYKLSGSPAHSSTISPNQNTRLG